MENHLAAQGFSIIDPDQQSVTEIAASLSGARIVVSVEGSQMAPAIYAIADGGALCLIQPPYRFNNVFKDYADCLGLHYGFTVGSEVTGGFIVEIAALQRTIAKLDALSSRVEI